MLDGFGEDVALTSHAPSMLPLLPGQPPAAAWGRGAGKRGRGPGLTGWRPWGGKTLARVLLAHLPGRNAGRNDSVFSKAPSVWQSAFCLEEGHFATASDVWNQKPDKKEAAPQPLGLGGVCPRARFIKAHTVFLVVNLTSLFFSHSSYFSEKILGA